MAISQEQSNRCATVSTNSGGIFDLPKREREIAALERQSAEPGFWDDPEAAQKTMQRLSGAQADIAPYLECKRRFDDASTLYELAQLEDDPDSFEAEIRADLDKIERGLEAVEVKTLLSGQYDANDAIVELKPGAGGTEACDWAQMLMRMYERWAVNNGYKVEILDELPGEVAGISSATLS
ncbi:MAG: PCRF domain-containing protein, partial [Armatimonadaceae bacterium]